MADDPYNAVCHDIYEQIYRALERRDDEPLRFATKGTARRVLHDENLRRFFQSLVSPGEVLLDGFRLSEDSLVSRMKERELHDFLAILIFAACGIREAKTFVTGLVASPAWPVYDSRGIPIGPLPAGREQLTELFDNVVAVDQVSKTQATFCTVVIRKREEVSIQHLDRQRLPYLEEKPLAKGAFGQVFQVKIARRHFYNPQEGLDNDKPVVLARKDYIIHADVSARGERDIMEKILTSSSRRCENILENFGSLAIGSNTYSLFMPLAICDLRAYMMGYHQFRPTTVMEKSKIILSAVGLAEGLLFLHSGLQTSDTEDLVCYHMDLKPSNILVFLENANGETRYVWKLSDFGMARVKVRHQGLESGNERDFTKLFVQRPQPQDPSLSATINKRGEGTYLAPESISSRRSMTTKSDVWSLGCVLSVIFAYLEEGKEGVEKYQEAREDNGYDRFFIRAARFQHSRLNKGVKNWHRHLIDRANSRNPREGEIVKYILRYLEDSVFEIDQNKRDGAKEVKYKLRETYRFYKILSDTVNNGTTEQPPGRFVKAVLGRVRPR
jgi:serine/threonine protein kinase